jgi:hypothetical protein
MSSIKKVHPAASSPQTPPPPDDDIGRLIFVALLALGFGLVHGLAFAKDLAPLLPTDAGGLWASWGWFALGIEGGQLLVVAAVFSLKWIASARGFNPRDFALALGAICLGVSLHLASQWYLEL